MTENDRDIGPIDYLIVEWPAGSPPTGEALPHLLDLVDRGVVRIIDLAFVTKDDDGNVAALDITDLDLDGDPDLAIFVGASSGLIDANDRQEAGEILEPGTSAALLIYENAWAAPFAAALRRTGAQLVARGPVPVDALIATLDELEAVDA